MPQSRVVYFAFACSGTAALIYEVAWTRLLGLVMGHTVAAATTVLAAFMGGLALGGVVGGRLATRRDRAGALRAYASLEMVIVLFALALPHLIHGLQSPLEWAYDSGAGGAAFAVIRLLGAIGIVALPAIAMGATLPLLVRWHVASTEMAGRDTGRLYAANTAGAALGAALSGFVFLPALGIATTTTIGMLLNVVSALTAGWLSRQTAPAEEITTSAFAPAQLRRDRSATPATNHRHLAMFALAASGAGALMLQLVWTRILAIAIGPTTYAFSAMVTTFIAGIAIGSVIGSWIAKRAASALALAAVLLVAAIAVAISGQVVPRLPLAIADIVSAPDASFVSVVWRQTLTIALVMLPMTTAFGVIWPIAVAVAIRSTNTAAADVGWLYTVNSAAAVGGALVTGLWLVPQWGLEVTLRAAGGLLAVAALVVALAAAASNIRRVVTVLASAAVLVAIVFLPRWDRALVASGAYKYAAYMPAEYREPMLRAGQLLYYKEGAAATVSVRRVAGTTSLAIDGKVDASDAGDMLTQKILAHAPLLLHRQARRVGIIGLGSGVTLGSALTHPIERADVIEISPEVVEASTFFAREHRESLRDPRTRLLVTDGRTHLSLTRDRYDVLISEPSNPWMAGIAALFTREFFEAAKARLAPGGVICQWAHTYDITDEDLRSIVATFTAVFPRALLWQVGDGDILLLGSGDSLDERLNAARQPWPAAVTADLAMVGVTSPDVLLSLISAGDAALRRYAGAAAVQTDDRLGLEFTGPRGLYGRTPVGHARRLREIDPSRQPDVSGELARSRGTMLLRAEAYDAAFDEFARSLQADPDDQIAVDGLLAAAGPIRKLEEAEALLERLHAHSARAAVAIGLSRLRAARGEFNRAQEPLKPFMSGTPPLRVLDQLASIAADAGHEPALTTFVSAMEQAFPGSEPAAFYSATLAALRSDSDRALRGGEALRARGDSARGLNLLASIYASLGRLDEARAALQASLVMNPRDGAVYEAIGALELRRADATAARDAFAEALMLDASSPSIREGLAAALAALKK